MPFHIALLGREEKHFHFIRSALSNHDYRFEFHSVVSVSKNTGMLHGADLIILDTLPFPENKFNDFFFLRETPELADIPVLGMVDEKPPRLRYRLVNMGIDDYITVPFDRLDIQVRVRNLLLRLDALKEAQNASSVEIGGASMMTALQTLNKFSGHLNQAFLKYNPNGFPAQVLSAIKHLCDADYTLLFAVRDEQVRLIQASPERLPMEGWSLAVTAIPVLVKAVRLKEPTILNNITDDNPLHTLLNADLNIDVRAFILYPVVIDDKTEFVLALLKSRESGFNDFHYLLVQNFSQLLIQSHYLANLRNEVKEEMNGQVWQFYFEFLDQIMNQLSFGILVMGQDERIKYLNENAAGLLDVSARDVLYQPVTDVMPRDVLDVILRSVTDPHTEVERPELNYQLADGRKIILGYTVQAFTDQTSGDQGYIISLKDITSTKELQEEMRRVDRLASLGVMASGIAHEIRNPLAGIKAMAQTFEEELHADDPKREYVLRIVRLVNRLDELLKTLFSYARPPKPNRQPCDIRTVLNDVVSLVRQKIRDQQIQLIEKVPQQLPRVFVDPSQIQQVLINLLLNGIEAIHTDGELQITIRALAAGQSGGARQVPYLALLQSESYVEIHIRDNGCGIPDENLKHIFNPFFTTKTFGTGLGLSIVHQIVKENAGAIFYESVVDKYTDCFLYLPAVVSEPVGEGVS